jgi:hypothetical protein
MFCVMSCVGKKICSNCQCRFHNEKHLLSLVKLSRTCFQTNSKISRGLGTAVDRLSSLCLYVMYFATVSSMFSLFHMIYTLLAVSLLP